MELTKTKLNNILKKYRIKLEQHNKEWEELCRKKCNRKDVGDMIEITTPSIYDHERHNSKGSQLFKDLMKEFDGYEVFPKKGAQAFYFIVPNGKGLCDVPLESNGNRWHIAKPVLYDVVLGALSHPKKYWLMDSKKKKSE